MSLPRQQFFCHCSSSSWDLNSSFHLNYFIIINLIFPLYLFRNFTVSSISLFMFILGSSFFLLHFYHLLSVIFLPFLEELLFRHNLTQPHLALSPLKLPLLTSNCLSSPQIMHLYHQYYNKLCMLRIITKYQTT